jgi:hypothetical protein
MQVSTRRAGSIRMSGDSITASTERVSAGSSICKRAHEKTESQKRVGRHMLLEYMIEHADVQESILDFFFMTTLHTDDRPWTIVPSRWSVVRNRFYAQNPYKTTDWREIDSCALINIEDKRHPLYKHIIHKRQKRKNMLQLITAETAADLR